MQVIVLINLRRMYSTIGKTEPTSSCHGFLYIPGFSFFTFGTLKTLGLTHFPELLGKPTLDNPDVLVLKTHVNLLCGGVAGAIAQTISYVYSYKSLDC